MPDHALTPNHASRLTTPSRLTFFALLCSLGRKHQDPKKHPRPPPHKPFFCKSNLIFAAVESLPFELLGISHCL